MLVSFRLPFFLLLLICAQANAQFFENSLRRSPLPDETAAGAIAKMTKTDGQSKFCSGFFIENHSGKNLVMSDRSCFTPNADSWCKSGGQVVDAMGGQSRTCQRVAISSTQSDIVIFEFDGPPPSSSLSLGAFLPTINARLVLYGHDKQAFRVVENCWVRSLTPSETLDTKKVIAKHVVEDSHMTHNCSVFSGGGGGPLLLEGTNIVVAIPNEFTKNADPEKQLSSHSVPGIDGLLIASFVSHQMSALESLKVDIAFNSKLHKIAAPSSVVFISGIYENQERYAGWTATMQAIYNTSDQLKKIQVWWNHMDGRPALESTFTCINDACQTSNQSSELRVVPNRSNEIQYTKVGETPVLFLKTKPGSF